MIKEINSQEWLEFTSNNLPAAVELGNLIFVKDGLSDFEIKDIFHDLLIDLRLVSSVRELRVQVIVELSLFGLHLVEVLAVVLESVSSQTWDTVVFSQLD